MAGQAPVFFLSYLNISISVWEGVFTNLFTDVACQTTKGAHCLGWRALGACSVIKTEA